MGKPTVMLDPKVVFRLLEDQATFATVLQIILLAKYGEDIYTVEPLELFLRLKEDYGVIIPEENESKIHAILLATSTDIFYDEPEAFRAICSTLADGDPGVELLDDLTVAEMLWGVYEVELNHGPEEFSPAVSALIDKEMQQEAVDLAEGDTPRSIVMAYSQERWQDLARQMSLLGIPATELPPLINGDPAYQELESSLAAVMQ